jgi:hypothetical protein
MDYGLWLFVLGYLATLFANIILLIQLRRTKSIYGLCPDTQQIFLLATISRVVWMFDTRLTTMYLAAFEVVANCLISVYITWMCY